MTTSRAACTHAIGLVLSSAMKECLSHPGVSTSRFAIVADLTRGGEFVRVAYEA